MKTILPLNLPQPTKELPVEVLDAKPRWNRGNYQPYWTADYLTPSGRKFQPNAMGDGWRGVTYQFITHSYVSGITPLFFGWAIIPMAVRVIGPSVVETEKARQVVTEYSVYGPSSKQIVGRLTTDLGWAGPLSRTAQYELTRGENKILLNGRAVYAGLRSAFGSSLITDAQSGSTSSITISGTTVTLEGRVSLSGLIARSKGEPLAALPPSTFPMLSCIPATDSSVSFTAKARMFWEDDVLRYQVVTSTSGEAESGRLALMGFSCGASYSSFDAVTQHSEIIPIIGL